MRFESVIHAPLTLPEDEPSLDAGLHFLRQMFNIALWEEMVTVSCVDRSSKA